MKSPRTLFAALAGWLTLGSAADAQVVAPPPKDETIELSPFEVVAEKDNGYRASGTLAGTRLRTDLKDVASSVSVITKDFMNDVGANNLADLLVYTTGTEVTGMGGNMSSADISSTNVDFDQVNRQPNSIVRIRSIGSGVNGADQARDYFTTDIPTDGYNIDRVEINRGPNAMLFGLGAPSGVVNSSLIKAGVEKNKTTVEFQNGQFGTRRGVLDHNQVLLKDRLGFRFSTLFGEQRYMQDPAFDRNQRYFGTLTYKPFKNTTVKANAEWGRRISNKPQARAPYEFISNWFGMGKPVYDPTTGIVSFLGTAPATTSPIYPATVNTVTVNGVPETRLSRNGNNLLSQMGAGVTVINENPNVRNLGISVPGYREAGVIAMELAQDRVHLSSFSANPTVGTNPYVNDAMVALGGATDYLRRLKTGLASATNNPTWNYWRTPSLTDPSIFDFYTNMVEGPNKSEGARWKAYNVTIEQRLGRNAAVEMAFDRQQLDSVYRNLAQGSGYGFNLDLNSKLLDGSTNPNFLRPFVRNIGWTESVNREREGQRITGYYDLDLRRQAKGWLGQLLGRHTFTGNISAVENKRQSFGGRPYVIGLDYWQSEQAANAGTTTVIDKTLTSDRGRGIDVLMYAGPSLRNATSPQNAGLQGLKVDGGIDGYTSVMTRYFQSPVINTQVPSPAQFKNVAFSAIPNTYWDKTATGHYTVSRGRQESLSKVFIANSRLLDDSVITTLGWRSDRFEAFDAGAANTDPNTGLKILGWDAWYPKSVFKTTINTFNYGIVGHTPRLIRERLPQGTEFSLTYNKSDNTSPTTPRFNVDGSAIPSPTGKTQEMGARLSVLNGKLELRVIKFETTAAYSPNNALRGPQNNILRQVRNSFANIVGGAANRLYSDPTNSSNDPASPAALAAQKAWNDFFAAQGKPFIDTFRFAGIGTSTITNDERIDIVVSTSDVVAEGMDYELVFNPTAGWRISANAAKAETVRSNTGEKLNAFADQITTLLEGPAGSMPQGTNSNTPLRDTFATLVNDIKKERALDGSPSPEGRKWRFNLVSNYTVQSGALKGLKFGGAMRWQDKIAIGYPIVNKPVGIVTFNPQYDVKNPFFGPEETNYDAWVGYSRRLPRNIRWSIQLNLRNIGVGKELIPVASQPDGSVAAYRIAEPQTWSLTNRFEF
jgi:hypothetical protein